MFETALFSIYLNQTAPTLYPHAQNLASAVPALYRLHPHIQMLIPECIQVTPEPTAYMASADGSIEVPGQLTIAPKNHIRTVGRIRSIQRARLLLE